MSSTGYGSDRSLNAQFQTDTGIVWRNTSFGKIAATILILPLFCCTTIRIPSTRKSFAILRVIRRCWAKANILPLERRRRSGISCDRGTDIDELANMVASIQVMDDLSASLGLNGNLDEISVNLVDFHK